MESRDYCTCFPEYWYTWKLEWIYIGDMCKRHDNAKDDFEGCANTGFYKDTWNAHLIGAVTIATVASLTCWILYTKKQLKRI